MFEPLSDIPTITPGGVHLTPSQRLALKQNRSIAIVNSDGSTLIVWLDSQGHLHESIHPADQMMTLDIWRRDHSDLDSEPESDNGYGP